MEENAGIVTDTRKHCSMTKTKKKGTINTSSGVIIAGMTSKESAIMETDVGIVTEMKEPDMTRVIRNSKEFGEFGEFGVLPIKMDLYKRKMMMWNRLNGEESNDLMKDVVKEQVKKVLPWFRQIVKIGKDLDIDIIQGRKMEKEKWKSIVKKKIMIATEKELRDETEKLKKYKEIAKDEIEVGKQKRYMRLPVKKAASLFRARTNQLDPSPRKPYWSRKWRCRFCREKTQDTKHYILECKKAQQILGGKITKEEMWRVITTLEGEDDDLKEVAGSLQRLYKEINR